MRGAGFVGVMPAGRRDERDELRQAPGRVVQPDRDKGQPRRAAGIGPNRLTVCAGALVTLGVEAGPVVAAAAT